MRAVGTAPRLGAPGALAAVGPEAGPVLRPVPEPVAEHGLGAADLSADPPDPALLADTADLPLWLRHRILPWRVIAGETVWATDAAERVPAAAQAIGLAPGEGHFVLTSPERLEAIYASAFGRRLAARAASWVPPALGVRGLDGERRRFAAAAVAALTLAIGVREAGIVALLMALFVMNALTALTRFAALVVGRREEVDASAPATEGERPPPLPVLSVLIPLYREAGMVRDVLRAVGESDYPADRLDVKIVVEERDTRTREALAAVSLPPPVSLVVVPHGAPRTKPRALNYALGFCRGEIVGILDAEDRPARDQFARVAQALGAAEPDVACVQCQLTYYNARENWITRCFELEYAIWFDVLLRGYQRLGLPIPLGGTSVYFRRDAIETLGGWDAHNVTEDADLGMRIVRAGMRCVMLDSVTEEEANCRAMPWVRQRSRWLKGYLLTWLSHMRAPRRLWREMGPRGFLGFNVLFLGGIVTYLAMPLFWLSVLGWAVTGQSLWASTLPGWALWPLGISLAIGQAVMLGCATLAMLRRRGLDLLLWVPLLPVYWTLGALAAWKAIAEFFVAPYYWDKTQHGVSRMLRRVPPVPLSPVATPSPATSPPAARRTGT